MIIEQLRNIYLTDSEKQIVEYILDKKKQYREFNKY